MKSRLALVVVTVSVSLFALALMVTLAAKNKPAAANVSVEEKLERIVIPKVEFKDASLAEVLNYLQEQSKALDPAGVGVEFVIADTGQPACRVSDMDVRNVPLKKILDYLNALTGYGYNVGEYGVYVGLPLICEAMLARTYDVPQELLPMFVNGEAQKNLKAHGIAFAEGTCAIYSPDSKKLVVRNFAKQLDKIDTLLKKLTADGHDKK